MKKISCLICNEKIGIVIGDDQIGKFVNQEKVSLNK